MSETHIVSGTCGAIRHRSTNAAARRIADWLCLAAAPTFAVMALLTMVAGNGAESALCSTAQHASSLNGMAVMYLLMSAFHSSSWLKLIAGR